MIGSCFSDEIGELLASSKFSSLSNPFGTIYNPISIFRILRDDINPLNTIENQGVIYHWDAHGSVSALSESETAKEVERLKSESSSYLQHADCLVITLGTSTVYQLNSSKEIVANCHKVGSKNFTKRFLTEEEILTDWEKAYEFLKKKNPDLSIIFTVSPVRHVRDGLVENNLSKSILIKSVHRIVSEFDGVSYFPSYEIMMDELRDYRFFAKDMIHPSDEAVGYIWDRFCQTYLDSESLDFKNEWGKISAAITHRPFQPNSSEHQKFLKKTIQQLTHFKEDIDVSKELEALQSQLL